MLFSKPQRAHGGYSSSSSEPRTKVTRPATMRGTDPESKPRGGLRKGIHTHLAISSLVRNGGKSACELIVGHTRLGNHSGYISFVQRYLTSLRITGCWVHIPRSSFVLLCLSPSPCHLRSPHSRHPRLDFFGVDSWFGGCGVVSRLPLQEPGVQIPKPSIKNNFGLPDSQHTITRGHLSKRGTC